MDQVLILLIIDLQVNLGRRILHGNHWTKKVAISSLNLVGRCQYCPLYLFARILQRKSNQTHSLNRKYSKHFISLMKIVAPIIWRKLQNNSFQDASGFSSFIKKEMFLRLYSSMTMDSINSFHAEIIQSTIRNLKENHLIQRYTILQNTVNS